MSEEISDQELKYNRVTREQYNMAVGLLQYFESLYNEETHGDYNDYMRYQVHQFISEQEKLYVQEENRKIEDQEKQ